MNGGTVPTTRWGTGRIDRSYRALRISWATRIALRWHARADRRAGMPLGMGADTTPFLQALVARHSEASERERTRFLADVRPIEVRLGRLEAELPSLHAAVDACTAVVERASVPLTEDQRTRRLVGEHDLPETLIRQRRQTAHDRAVADAVAKRSAAEQARDVALAEQAELLARRQNLAQITCSRVLRYGDFIRRQAALYRRALVRKHADREVLAHEWRTDLFPVPGWATVDALVSSSREVGAAA